MIPSAAVLPICPGPTRTWPPRLVGMMAVTSWACRSRICSRCDEVSGRKRQGVRRDPHRRGRPGKTQGTDAEERHLDRKSAEAAKRDGTFGKDSAGPALRAAPWCPVADGGEGDNTETIIKTLQEGQRRNGGFGKDGLGERRGSGNLLPHSAAFHAQGPAQGRRRHAFLCRQVPQQDGGYAVAPGMQSSLSGTYYAANIRHWLELKN